MNRNTQQLADASLSAEEITEEADYVNAAVFSVEEKETIPGRKCSSFIRSFAPLAVCWLILLVIIGLRIYYMNSKLSSDNEKLKRDHNNLRVRFDNLTAAKWDLTMKNEELSTQNQELETAKKNLTEQMHIMETNWNKLNASRAQWSIDAYCPKEKYSNERKCKSCQSGWKTSESNCYAINNPVKSDDLRNWTDAQEDCRGKNSDLVVVVNEAEKTFVNDHSWPHGNFKQYWIGLRAEDKKWKWVDGTDLTDKSWIQESAPDGFCAVSVSNQGWKAVSCDQKNRWICKKKALSV